MKEAASRDQLLLELEELRARLYEAEETLRAIRGHEVDALLIDGAEGQQVFTLKGAEQPYRIFMEEMNEGAATVTPDGTVLYCNGRLAEMLKTPLNKIIGSSLADFVVPEKGQPLLTMLETCGVEGCKGETYLRGSDGGGFAVSLTAHPLMLDEVAAFGLVITDLTDQKEAQQALRAEINERKKAQKRLEKARDELEQKVAERTADLSQANAALQAKIAERKRMEERNQILLAAIRRQKDRLSALVNSIQDEVWFADTEKRFTLVNPSALQEFGLEITNGVDVGKLAKSLEVYRPDGSPRPVDETPPLRALKGEVVTNQEEIIRTPASGELRYRQVSAAPVRDASGTIIGSVSVVRDITERRQAEDALKTNLERLDIISSTAGQLLASKEPQKIVEALCRRVMEHLDCHAFFNFLVDEERSCLRLNAYAGIPEETAREIHFLDFGVAVCGCAARDACRIVAENIPTKPDIRTDLVRSFGIKAYACHPLFAQGGVIGTLSFGTKSRLTFTDDELFLMKTVADQVATAMERVRLLQAAEERADELEARVEERTAELLQTQEKLVHQSRVLEAFFTSTITPLVFLDRHFNFIRVNQAYAKVCQKEIAEFQGHNHFEFYPHEENEAIFRQVVETKIPYRAIARPFTFRDHPEWGTTYWDWTLTPLLDDSGGVEFLVFSLEDVTGQKHAEEQLRQVQKMQAIGTLAGGIAHDFNNILAAIIGFTQMVLDDVADSAHVHHKMERVLQAGLRGRDLVRQILAFSRKTEREHKEISLTPLVKETHALLRASLPATIRMPLAITTNDDHVISDPTQLQQVLMNLATNAAYAMREDGGLLTIGLSSVTFPPGSLLPDPEMEPGTYVQLTVQDTGTGMTDEVKQRIFEPFFTTKKPGQGTGMGLAVVYGIVKAHGGALTAQSEPGQGSTFEVFLPHAEKPEARKEAATTSVLPTGTERILFVDDEEMLVEMARGMLQSLGYEVTVAQHGSEAWNLFLEDPSRFDLVITDQTMPDVTGVTLARQLLRVRKEMPIVLCTGYSERVSAETARDVGICEFVMKPVVKKELAEIIRRVLDGRKMGI